MQLHDPDTFELKRALEAFQEGGSMLSEICGDLGVRPGPVYDEYVTRLKEDKGVPTSNLVRFDVPHHSGFDRIYNDLPLIVKTVELTGQKCFLYELADYEPLPDTEWAVFLIPGLGFLKLYTSLFYDLGCYVEVVHPDPANGELARNTASRVSDSLNEFYRKRVEREKSLSHG